MDINIDELYKYQNVGFTNYVGIKVTEMKEGFAKGEIEIKDFHHNPIGSIHGGAVFSLADTVGGFAACTVAKKVTTVRSDINYINPTLNVTKLVAEANVIKAGKRMIIVEIVINDQDGKMLQKAMMTYFRLKDDGKAV